MRSMPRVYRSFEEFERDELNQLNDELSVDDMLDEMFSEELDTDFKKGRKGSQSGEAVHSLSLEDL